MTFGGKALRIAGVVILAAYAPTIVVALDSSGVWIGGTATVGVALGLAAVAWLGWWWPGLVGGLLLVIGLILLVAMVGWLSSSFLNLSPEEKIRTALLLAPPSVVGAIFLLAAGHQRTAREGAKHQQGER